jgi:hypothetical protein
MMTGVKDMVHLVAVAVAVVPGELGPIIITLADPAAHTVVAVVAVVFPVTGQMPVEPAVKDFWLLLIHPR